MELHDSVRQIKGVGEKTANLFAKLDIFTIQDLLEHYPKNYETYDEIRSIDSCREDDTVIIEGSFAAMLQTKKVRKLTVTTGRFRDYSGDIMLTWFNMPFLQKQLRVGTQYIFRGKVSRKNNMLVIDQPQQLTREEYIKRLHVLQPVYALTTGLTNHIMTKSIRSVIEEITLPTDYLPIELRKEYDLEEWKKTIKEIHFPKSRERMIEARKRIVFDEFFLFSLAVARIKNVQGGRVSSYCYRTCRECEELVNRLPYTLTAAQMKVWQEMQQDMQSGKIMNRLVQGDVGSGKTILAVLGLLMTVKNGYQGAIMVPTEVLAKQHYESLCRELEPFGVRVGLLVGSMTASKKRDCYQQLKEQKIDIIVGTHALIQEKVEYASLAFVVTDEQHRFGVRQREAIAEKGKEPHVLVMSATPIPRTLAVILYGDLDLSVINELPAERLPIKNCVVGVEYRKTSYRFIEKEVQQGRQAYVICPMVEESETVEAENVMDYTEVLRENLSPGIVVEYLHGKMKAAEKNEIMERFAGGEISVLVSTTVVEVGINVPNATVMMIENAERFGLAQLHQLRGRVGRGKHQSYCILIQGKAGKETKERLEILNQSNDGFYIAQEDLKLRGPGDLFGIRQSGMLEFKMADVFNDAAILQQAHEAAFELLKEEGRLELKKYEKIKERLEHYQGSLSL